MQEYNQLTEYIGYRRRFDPANKKDLIELAYFQQHGRWKTTCPFLLEWPHKDIISMCRHYYTEYMMLNLEQ